MGTYAAFAYTTALNHLLTDREHVQHIGDSTVVCWAAGGQSAYQDLGMAALYGDSLPQRDLQAVLGKLARGEAVEWDDTTLDPEVRFYVLGLAPNAARLSVPVLLAEPFWRLCRQPAGRIMNACGSCGLPSINAKPCRSGACCGKRSTGTPGTAGPCPKWPAMSCGRC